MHVSLQSECEETFENLPERLPEHIRVNAVAKKNPLKRAQELPTCHSIFDG
jgi:hypothetical protein